ncbi:MAG TPA: FAD-binding oxidoreductase [Methanomassiliicoccales archaeon]|nr:FAD-binding oxidoreductase [Methanomassiliicoccales archaeon]
MAVIRSSPWLQEIDNKRELVTLERDTTTDILVIGAGIAGMSTAYHLLKHTDRTVTVVDKSQAGHGASGRNGGQGIASIERPFLDLVKALGGKKAAALLNGMEEGHDLIRSICEEVSYPGTPVPTFAWSGAVDTGNVNSLLQDLALRKRHGVPVERILLAKDRPPEIAVPPELLDSIVEAEVSEINSVLRAKHHHILAFSTKVTLANSSLLSEMIARKMLSDHPDRFYLYEHNIVSEITAGKMMASMVGSHMIESKEVILCTNGYEPPLIRARGRPLLEAGLRQFVASMVAYETGMSAEPGAILLHHESSDPEEEPYYYITRRPYGPMGHDMVSVGGPQALISGEPEIDREYPAGVYARIHDFTLSAYAEEIMVPPRFYWNGLMGYTQGGIRMVGPDPHVRHLWYNLGCNGVGLLSSLVGGRTLAKQMAVPDG